MGPNADAARDELRRSIPLSFADLFSDPLREVTRQRQQQVLVAGVLSVILALGVTIKTSTVGPIEIDGRFLDQPLRVLAIAVTLYLTTVYWLTWYEDWVAFDRTKLRRLSTALRELSDEDKAAFKRSLDSWKVSQEAWRREGAPLMAWLAKENELTQALLTRRQTLIAKLREFQEGTAEHEAAAEQIVALSQEHRRRMNELGPAPTLTSPENSQPLSVDKLEAAYDRGVQEAQELSDFLTTFQRLHRRRALLELVLPLVIGALGVAALSVRVLLLWMYPHP